jgi:hypothetical protein
MSWSFHGSRIRQYLLELRAMSLDTNQTIFLRLTHLHHQGSDISKMLTALPKCWLLWTIQFGSESEKIFLSSISIFKTTAPSRSRRCVPLKHLYRHNRLGGAITYITQNTWPHHLNSWKSLPINWHMAFKQKEVSKSTNHTQAAPFGTRIKCLVGAGDDQNVNKRCKKKVMACHDLNLTPGVSSTPTCDGYISR